MPHIAADNLTALAAVLFGLAWLGFWADRHPIARKVSGIPWVLTAGLLLSNTGIIPTESPAYGFVGQYLLPLAVPFLLFKANVRTVFRDGGWVLPAFLIASLGICIGTVTGFYLFNLGPEAAKIAGTYTGAFIGGMVNFIAISQAVSMTPTTFSGALSALTSVSILGLMVLMVLPSFAFVRRHIHSRIIDEVNAAAMHETVEEFPRLRLDHVSAGIAISLAICALSNFICTRLHLGTYNLFVITIITVILANLAPRQFAKLEGDFALGMLCMYVFFAIVGAGIDAFGFLRVAPMLFVYCSFIIALHFVVLLFAAKLFKLDLADVIIGSAAAFLGAATAAAIATAKGWKTLITPAITMGILGYVIANFIGIAIARWLS